MDEIAASAGQKMVNIKHKSIYGELKYSLVVRMAALILFTIGGKWPLFHSSVRKIDILLISSSHERVSILMSCWMKPSVCIVL